MISPAGYTSADVDAARADERQKAEAEMKEQLRIAFVQGAKWWEWYSRQATMWQSDQDIAHIHAERLESQGRLGVDPHADIEHKAKP